jgi:3D (Asp-Asp-Asp) domain-containing protein
MVYSPRSKCCYAPVYTSTADEGTSYYVCTRCHGPCDARLMPSGARPRRFPWFLLPLAIVVVVTFLLMSAPSVGKVPDRPLESVPTVISPSLGSDGGVETMPQPSLAPTWRTVTAYTSEEAQTDSTPCLAADGSNICHRFEEGETLCGANFVPLGTVLVIDNSDVPDGEDAIVCVVADRLSSRFPNRVDLYMGMDTARAIEFGARMMYVSELTID